MRGSPYGVDDLVLLHFPAVPRSKSQKLYKPWQGWSRLFHQVHIVLWIVLAHDVNVLYIFIAGLNPAPIGNVAVAERIVNEEKRMEHSGDTVEENEEELRT